MLVTANNFAEAHYDAIAFILARGASIPTDYDKPDEPMSLDLPLMIEVTDSWNPPIFSKCVWDSAKGLLDYRDEVLYGTHDHLTDMLGYTYHDRIKDQLVGMFNEIYRYRHSRRAQVITWIPEVDQRSDHPPCLQRVWIRERDGKLDLHTHWRSRDMLKAWGSNVFAFSYLHKYCAESLLNCSVGVYREFIDSAHIYGRDIDKAKAVIERPIEKLEWTLDDIEKEAIRERDDNLIKEDLE